MPDIHVERSAAKRAEGVEAWWLSSLTVPRMSKERVRQTPKSLGRAPENDPSTGAVGFPHISNKCIGSERVTIMEFISRTEKALAVM